MNIKGLNLTEIKLREQGGDKFPYLDLEDSQFAIAFRLTEEEVIQMHNGLVGYTKFRLDRDRLRSIGKVIPTLPTEIPEGLLRQADNLKIDAKALAANFVAEQRNAVEGTLGGIQASARLFESMRKQEEANVQRDKQLLASYQQEGAARYGVKPASQTAQDYAEKKLADWKQLHGVS